MLLGILLTSKDFIFSGAKTILTFPWGIQEKKNIAILGGTKNVNLELANVE